MSAWLLEQTKAEAARVGLRSKPGDGAGERRRRVRPRRAGMAREVRGTYRRARAQKPDEDEDEEEDEDEDEDTRQYSNLIVLE